jgi:ketosteroid isomerase-like protein
MPQDDVDRINQVVDAVNARDLDAYLALMHDDVEVVSRLAPIEGSYHGHDGIRAWWDSVLGTWPDFHIEVVDVRAAGDDVSIGELRLHGVGAGSGIPSDWTVFSPGRWRAGKCVWWGSYATEAEALAALKPEPE